MYIEEFTFVYLRRFKNKSVLCRLFYWSRARGRKEIVLYCLSFISKVLMIPEPCEPYPGNWSSYPQYLQSVETKLAISSEQNIHLLRDNDDLRKQNGSLKNEVSGFKSLR